MPDPTGARSEGRRFRKKGKRARFRQLVVFFDNIANLATPTDTTDALNNDAEILQVLGATSAADANNGWLLEYFYQAGEKIVTEKGIASSLVGKDGQGSHIRPTLKLPRGVQISVGITNQTGGAADFSVTFNIVEWIAKGRAD